AQTLYKETHLSIIEQRLTSDEDIFQLLQNDQDAQLSLTFENEAHEKMDYLCMLKSFPQKNEKILTMIHYIPEEEPKNCSAMLNRFDFIETLKNKLAQQSIDDKNTSFILINISNLDKLNLLFKSTAIHESFKKFLNKIFHLKEENQEVVQWSPNLYIIVCENLSFERLCEQTRYVQQELINVTVEEKITPIIISSALMANNKDLNETLSYIDKINAKKLLAENIEKIKFYQIDYLENVLDEQEQILYLMRNCVNNKIPIKLLNIYKGMCINTNSHVLKINEETYHLYCENLQGYAMQLEGHTVLQAPNFSKDIRAEVSIVDIKKSFAILKNLTFMPHSANNRQHTRVQTNIRTPILIRYGNKASAQGEILDISVNSIAMKVNGKSIKEDIKNQTIKLNFSLPNETGENGYVIMDIEAKVTCVLHKEDYSKVVVMLGALHKPYDDYLLHYMYTRQKELILEIRRATKVYN
ncbi:MAG: pilus assembly protein PilZ, partial [Campylobacteraceae bacterium]|nr:pilus assembly protein PilZ [Campylobacteraceae bacterium]